MTEDWQGGERAGSQSVVEDFQSWLASRTEIG